ncbi:hypothetical protein GBA52_014982 [Prunus armeniaca]|nr:hypothetical protein GBA52_014982 [Prunus armeniaca]
MPAHAGAEHAETLAQMRQRRARAAARARARAASRISSYQQAPHRIAAATAIEARRQRATACDRSDRTRGTTAQPPSASPIRQFQALFDSLFSKSFFNLLIHFFSFSVILVCILAARRF